MVEKAKEARVMRAKAVWCVRAAWRRRGARRHLTGTVMVGYFQAAGQCDGHACTCVSVALCRPAVTRRCQRHVV